MAHVALEALVVGLALGLLTLALSKVFKGEFMLGFAAGVVGHLAFQIAGANAWYCLHGAACRRD